MDNNKRSVAKSVTWRVLATLTTMALVFAFTGELALAASIGFFEVIAKMIIYYAHERAWNMVAWGRER